MKENTASRNRRKYDSDFKAEALRMVEDGRSVSEVAQALGIGENLLYRWRRRYRAKLNEPLAPVHQVSSLAQENAQLKAALRRAEQERDILKKSDRRAALSIFSQQT